MAFFNRFRAESGLTLIEVLMAVAILGIAFAAIVGGMATSIITSDVHRNRANVETVLRSFAEHVKAHGAVDCPAGAYATSFSHPLLADGFAVSMTDCADDWNGSDGLQLLKLQASSPAGGRQITQDLEVVKRG